MKRMRTYEGMVLVAGTVVRLFEWHWMEVGIRVVIRLYVFPLIWLAVLIFL